MRLRHIGIVSKNLEGSLDFYRRWFDCRIAREMNECGDFISTLLVSDNVEVRTVKLNFPDGHAQLELLQFHNPQVTDAHVSLFSQGLTHFALQVKGLDALFQAMSEADVLFLSPPSISDDGLAKVCFCKDPNGVFIELVEHIKQ